MVVRMLLGVAALVAATPASAQFTGEIVMSGFGFCPPNTRVANGDLVPIQKTAPSKSEEDYRDLYLLYGTAYGGDGVTTFALPDLRAQQLSMNTFGRGALTAPSASETAAPAMRVELPVVFCVVLHGAKVGK